MIQKDKWKWLLVIFLIAWALYEIYPPTPKDLIDEFERQAEITDTNLYQIISKARQIAKGDRLREYQALLIATGTNDLTRYFSRLVTDQAQYLGVDEKNQLILQELQKRAAGQIRLGLDLQGGVSFLLSVDTNRLETAADKRSALQQAVATIRRRVDKLGVSEPLIQPVGENKILVQLPGLSEAEKESARRQLQRAAFLEFRLVHPDTQKLLQEGIIEPGYEVLNVKKRRASGQLVQEQYLVEKRPAMGLTGKYVRRAFPDFNPLTGRPIVRLEFNSEGARIFSELTQKYVGHQLAIVLDGELYSAPVIREPILGGQAEISGDFTVEEAVELANVLQNPLEAPLHLEEERSVDPTLGRDSIKSGIRAGLLGTALVGIFMIYYYRFAGLVATVALLLNALLIVGALCAVDAALTLPGIAGIVLAIGMAVDANVLIYERIREELKAGKSLRGAIEAGYAKAFGTILDSNVTTLIAGIILIFKGSGPIQGFGVTLTIGICASMFTALVFTRLIYNYGVMKGWLKGFRFVEWIGVPQIDYLKIKTIAVAASVIVILIGWIWAFYRGADVLGVDFKGGDEISFQFEKKIEVDQIRRLLTQSGVGDVRIQYQRQPLGGHELLSIVCGFGQGEKVESILKEKFPEAAFSRVSLNEVGPAITGEILASAVTGLAIAILGILLYVAVRYEYSFALAAIIALLHDALIALAMVYLFDKQVNSAVMAAILTVIGYSVNDTIVIFDRIRENLRLGLKGSFAQIINYSINQTLSRTLITAGTTLLTALVLLVLGGGAVNDFAFVMCVGIIIGTFSSLYIATNFVLWWYKGQKPKLAAPESTVAIPESKHAITEA